MGTRKTYPILFVTVLLTGATSRANAYPVTFEFSGTINSIGDPDGLLDGSIVVGSPFAGTFTFESTMTDDLPGDAHRGLYTSPAPPSSIMSVSVGDYHFIGPSRELHVENWDKDSLVMRSYDFASEGFAITNMRVFFLDLQGTAMASDALPLAPPALAPFEVRDFSISGNAGGTPRFSFGGNVTVLTPEPVSLTPFALGALVLLRRGLRRTDSVGNSSLPSDAEVVQYC